jgi:3-isopropylmalate/(R)-2-methylmalate dehydratase small subunit
MGKVFKYGDNVDTDVIIPARYLTTGDEKELAKHAMEDIDPKFSWNVRAGDIIVAGKNFGSGSSREHAPLALKGAGVEVVIAESFARIFYRNSFNVGLPILESEEASKKVQHGDELEVDFQTGIIKNLTKKESYKAQPFPDFMSLLIKRGGLVSFVKSKLD